MNFYKHLKSFDNFLDLTETKNYCDVPGDWYVLITDIEGSTKAISEGKYKTVNMIGAASISVVINITKDLEVPLVFGGDGSTVLISPIHLSSVKSALRTLQLNCINEFNMKLRVGFVPISFIHDSGLELKVAKYKLAGGPNIAFFMGAGFDYAEKSIKSGKFLLDENTPVTTLDEIMKGLSCRWAPIKNKNGTILTLMIKSREKDYNKIKNILFKINSIINLGQESTNPIFSKSFSLENIFLSSQIEGKLSKINSRIKIIFYILITKILSLFNLSIGNTKMNDYIKSLSTHSDYKKFDECIRMVIDCSTEQKNQILEILEKSYNDNTIFYGQHCSESALTTCFVQSLEQGKHLHFIDGNDGGYALAAKQLKEQLKKDLQL